MNTQEIAIRKALPEDEEVFYRLNCGLSEKELSRHGFSAAFRENIALPNACYLAADKDGKIIGMGSCHVQWHLHHAAPVAEIMELYVVPEHRSGCIGASLLEKLIEFAKSKNAVQVELSTHKRREDAHRFYAREGFECSHFKWVKILDTDD
jgi:PhnO protein